MLRKSVGVIVPLFGVTLCLLMLHSLRQPRFPCPLLSSALAPIFTAPVPVPIKTPITQVYSRHQNPSVSSPTLAVSSLDLVQNDDLLIALYKGKL